MYSTTLLSEKMKGVAKAFAGLVILGFAVIGFASVVAAVLGA